jgi:hypothetical protein
LSTPPGESAEDSPERERRAGALSPADFSAIATSTFEARRRETVDRSVVIVDALVDEPPNTIINERFEGSSQVFRRSPRRV